MKASKIGGQQNLKREHLRKIKRKRKIQEKRANIENNRKTDKYIKIIKVLEVSSFLMIELLLNIFGNFLNIAYT